MNGGALDPIERASEGDLARAMAGFRWLRLEPVADLLASVRTDIDSGALNDPERTDALEPAADSRYQALLSSDEALPAAFSHRLVDDPHAFSAALQADCYLDSELPNGGVWNLLFSSIGPWAQLSTIVVRRRARNRKSRRSSVTMPAGE